MKCPHCVSADSRVVNSRPANGGQSIRRRRECVSCKGRFTTIEAIEQEEKTVIKRSGKRELYSRERLLNSLVKACRKGDVPMAHLENIVNYVEKQAFQKNLKEVTTKDIGALVLKRLRDVDHVAYLRFASVYKEFRGLQDFKKEIESLLKK